VMPGCEVLVEVFDHHGDFSVRTVGFEGFLALGACFGCVLTMLSPQCELRGQFAWAQTAVHEYAHVVTLALSHNRVPRWLTEGVSVFEEKKADPVWARELERDVLNARANGWIFPVEHLDEAFRDGQTVMLGYYEGSLLCELIERDFGFDKLKDTVAGYADGSDTGAVIRKVLGIEPAELDRRFADYLQKVVAGRAALRPKYNEAGKDLLRAAVAAGDVDSELALASAYHDLGRRADEESALDAYLKVRGETPAAKRVLAERDLEAGRKDSALKRLNEWEQTGSIDADGLHLLADLLAASGDKDGAKAKLRRACEVFPSDVGHGSALEELLKLTDPKAEAAEFEKLLEVLCSHDENEIEARLKLAELARARGDTATALRRTQEAAELDPYRPEVRMDLADMLLEQGDKAGARAQWTLVLGMRAGQMPKPPGGDEQAPPLGFALKGSAPTLENFQARARKHLAETDESGTPQR
jgi:cellulose synthase operon protein C